MKLMVFHRFPLRALLILLILASCSDGTPTRSESLYCGESFCIKDVDGSAVTKTSPLHDVNRYFLSLPIGQVEIFEGNSPNIRNLQQERVLELQTLNAWSLSPTPEPTILVIVGTDWPETLVFSIEDGSDSRRQLVALMQGLQLQEPKPEPN